MTAVFARSPARRNAISTDTCRDAWPSYDQAIKFCAHRYAATHPASGYPASLREIGPDGDGCLKGTYHHATFREHSLVDGDNRYTYVAGPADHTGRIASYEIHRHR